MQKISRECPVHTVEQSGSVGFAEEKHPLYETFAAHQKAKTATENENGMSMNI